MRFEELFSESGMQVYRQIVVKAWTDADFKSRLVSNPGSALSEFNVTAPDGVAIRTVENSVSEWNFVLPATPDDGELTDADLEEAAGGCVGF